MGGPASETGGVPHHRTRIELLLAQGRVDHVQPPNAASAARVSTPRTQTGKLSLNVDCRCLGPCGSVRWRVPHAAQWLAHRATDGVRAVRSRGSCTDRPRWPPAAQAVCTHAPSATANSGTPTSVRQGLFDPRMLAPSALPGHRSLPPLLALGLNDRNAIETVDWQPTGERLDTAVENCSRQVTVGLWRLYFETGH